MASAAKGAQWAAALALLAALGLRRVRGSAVSPGAAVSAFETGPGGGCSSAVGLRT